MKQRILFTAILAILSLSLILYWIRDVEPPQTEIEVIIPDERFPR